MNEKIKNSIYTLVDPRTDAVCYVGMSFYPLRRFNSHCSPSSKSCTCAWITELKSIGLNPRMEIIEVCDTNYGEREAFWINHFSALNSNLLNVSVHGGGGRPPISTSKHKVYKFKLPTEAAEWAKENGGLSEIVRDCLEQRYQRSASSAGDVLKETKD